MYVCMYGIAVSVNFENVSKGGYPFLNPNSN